MFVTILCFPPRLSSTHLIGVATIWSCTWLLILMVISVPVLILNVPQFRVLWFKVFLLDQNKLIPQRKYVSCPVAPCIKCALLIGRICPPGKSYPSCFKFLIVDQCLGTFLYEHVDDYKSVH